MILDIRHPAIVADDEEEFTKLIRFYKEILGMKEVWNEIEDYEQMKCMLGSVEIYGKKIEDQGCVVWSIKLAAKSGAELEIMKFIKPRTVKILHGYFCTGISHISFTVDDLDEIIKRIKKSGLGEIISESCEAKLKPVKIAVVKDPGGNFIELVEEKNMVRKWIKLLKRVMGSLI